jgi:hypothetical protein
MTKVVGSFRSSCIRAKKKKVPSSHVFQRNNVYTKFRVNRPVGSKVQREATHTHTDNMVISNTYHLLVKGNKLGWNRKFTSPVLNVCAVSPLSVEVVCGSTEAYRHPRMSLPLLPNTSGLRKLRSVL